MSIQAYYHKHFPWIKFSNVNMEVHFPWNFAVYEYMVLNVCVPVSSHSDCLILLRSSQIWDYNSHSGTLPSIKINSVLHHSTAMHFTAEVFVHINMVAMQSQRKWSGCCGFGQTSFSQGKNKIPFLKKQVIKKGASIIFGLVRLIMLSYNR